MSSKYLLIAALFATCLGGCIMDENPIGCTDIAVSSANVTVINELGDPVIGADVRFQTVDVAEQSCEEFGQDGVYTCGFEVSGALMITIVAEGFEPAQASVEVGSDACHVITEQISVTLTTQAQPA